MTALDLLAKQYNDLIQGENITGVSLLEVLNDVSWQEATTPVSDCNTIATLVYHMFYYVKIVGGVLKGGALDGNDAMSFKHPPVTSEKEWNALLAQIQEEAAEFTRLLLLLPEEKLSAPFETYGTYYRNLHGLIEHSYYHLGQISLLKKLVRRTT